MNKVILVGFVGKAPETKKFDTWQKSSFSLATARSYKDSKGDWQKATEWHNISCTGGSSKLIEQYVSKGSRLLIEGEIRYNEFERDGQKRYFTEIVAHKVELLDRLEKSETVKENGNDDLPF